MLAGEQATLKRYDEEPNGRVRLQPAGAALDAISATEFEIRGVVIGVIRRC